MQLPLISKPHPTHVNYSDVVLEQSSISRLISLRDCANNVQVLLKMARATPVAYEIYCDAKCSESEPNSRIHSLTFQAVLGSAALGRIYYDLIKPPGIDADKATRLAATALTIIEGVDNYIDSHPLPTEDKIDLLENINKLLCDGKFSREALTALGAPLAERARFFAHTLASMQRPEIFIKELNNLVSVVSDELRGTITIERAEQIGGSTMALAPALCLAASPAHNDLHLHAARHFGAIIKLIDDMSDLQLDRDASRHTFATLALDENGAYLAAKNRVQLHAEELIRLLSRKELSIYKSLLQLGSHKWSLAIFGLTPDILH